jgi:hypothetical protein
VTFWFDEAVVDAWEHENEEKKNGRPFVYSDLAIETLLTIRELFRLPYRQTEGLGRSLAKLMGAQIVIPHHTSLQKRAAKLNVKTRLRGVKGPIDVVVDGAGLKPRFWRAWRRGRVAASLEIARKHGAGKRRTWRKRRLAIDPATHEIVGHTLTENNVHDADQVEPLLDQIDGGVTTFYGDGPCTQWIGDQWKVYETLDKNDVGPIIPPRKNAKIKQHGNASADPLPRDESVRQIRRDGRKAWAESIDYHRRSLAETGMHRIKSCFGEALKNRELVNQQTEAALRCKLLNWFVTLGMPAFLWSG